ncbi:amino acid adenylation domain-containing protein [Nocardia terpenica]|uniref:amino acid adenylation domain-containing protein n=1 Tax=Nocardia terpenica TaxID=455432 RepID=UPI0018935E65|nr:non-ribosomal peptide synthetase [Nocardia terpenica]MBF6061285.1 amino acid adenylation domain-containing protein [Nocardia terpenica]MBF6105486.1 amino acid adenylation domain-containing protein [Nocardia terpenica]MBF6113044.1 amino acid adenylation domain-containing protein [Nocardia terpenica]MBF6119174.1 amino acid adenylation domain-containing protein [Nocardia terpenica]MBF6152822.1 amino acid adenylation domain-containing protein [Nocardia terpenica]
MDAGHVTADSTVEAVLPLSPLQEGFVFHAEHDDRHPDMYVLQQSYAIEGPLRVGVLERSVAALLRRHPNLRVGFRTRRSGQVVQVVYRDQQGAWAFHDLSGQPEEEIERVLRAERERGVDLRRPPLVRFTVIRHGRDRYRLAMTNHHAVLDGWSVPLLMRELLALYAAGGDERPLGRPPRYRDYLAWLVGRDHDDARLRWREAFAGLDEPTLLTDPHARRAAAPPVRADRVLTAALSADLRRRAAGQGVTLNTVVQAAWGITLAHHMNRDDIVVGTTVSGRPPEVPGIETMIGLFINTVPARIRLDPHDTAAALLTRLHTEQARLQDSGHLSLPDIQRAAGFDTLFDIGMVFENLPADMGAPAEAIDGLRVRAVGSDGYDRSHYPLGLIVVPGERLRLGLSHDPSVIGEATAGLLLDRVTRVLTALAETADRPVGSLTSLPDAARREVLYALNDTRVGHEPVPFHRLILDRARATPEAVAVIGTDTRGRRITLTYAELVSRATALAATLAARGVGPETLVALVLPRSVEVPVGMLAVHIAGGAFVPVDWKYPAERIAHMLRDARPVSAIVCEQTMRALPENMPTLRVDGSAVVGEIGSTPAEFTPPNVHVDSAAYLIYTSGSTGTPKGVVVTHRGAANFVAATRDRLRIASDSRVLQFASPSFDGIIGEVMPALAAGATVVVAPAELGAGIEVRDWIVRQGITHAVLPPAAVAAAGRGRWASLRTLAVVGEACPPELVADLAADVDLVNGYGPTEMTVSVTQSDPLVPAAGHPPIGRPLDDVRVYLLDRWLHPVARGAVGELYAGGPGIARGYYGQFARTAARFVADPYGEPGARLYRTGDLARWRPDGQLEFVARGDDQLKVRGFRVDPREIEAVLTAHADIARALVVGVEYAGGDRRPVAYVVPEGGARPDRAMLRELVAARLPGYLVPAAFVVLDRFPVTVNGKIDRAALPLPDRDTAASGRPPRTHREQLLCDIAADLLGLDGIGVEDDFFELGGHSLLAARLVSRVREVFDVEVPVRVVFRARTVARIAAALDAAGAARTRLRRRADRPAVVPMSSAQQRLWLVSRVDGASSAYNIPVLLRLDGELDRAALPAALADVLARHEILRTVYAQDDTRTWQRVLDPDAEAVRAVTEIPEIVCPAAEVADAVHDAVCAPFDLERESPLRARLIAAADRTLLLLVVHHIACDGWSLGPLMNDLARAYAARRAGRAPRLPELPVQYADYTLWQRDVLGTVDDPASELAAQLRFWRAALDGAPEELPLPADHPRPATLSHRGDSIDVEVDPILRNALRDIANREQASLFMLLHLAVAVVLSRFGGGEDIVVGSPVAGRTDEALTDLVGFFVNTLVLRTDLSGDPTVAQALARVREADLAAYAHQDLPFEHLVDALNPTRATNRHPLFQVMLSLDTAQGPDAGERYADETGLRVTAEPVREPVARFDLSFAFAERPVPGGGTRLTMVLEYSTDLFERATADSLAAAVVHVLEGIAGDAGAALHGLPVYGEAERNRLLREWNTCASRVGGGDPGQKRAGIRVFDPGAGTRVLDPGAGARVLDPSAGVTFLELFGERVRDGADRLAVFDGVCGLTYVELERRANRLAHCLADRVVPGDVVAVAVPRSVEWVVAVVAVMKAGGAFAVLDTEYPVDRLERMMALSAPALTVTTVAEGARIPGGERLVIDEPRTRERIDSAPDHAVPQRYPRADQPAYIVFTSGSTGEPKGIVTAHGGFAGLADAFEDTLGVGTDSRVLQAVSPSFDGAVGDIAQALLRGGALVLAPPGRLLGAELADYIAAQRITHLFCPPAVLQTMDPDVIPGPVTFVVGGEPMPPHTAARWSRRHRVLNAYGPSETSIFATFQPVTDPDPARSVPIGAPLAGKRIHILDHRLRPVPVGVPGELYIGGPGVAQGYLRRPAFTAERFVADPFGAPGDRLYRTGDLGRWLRTGVIDCLGRTDTQVKVRGFRIELAEIEQALLADDTVDRAHVIVREDRPGDRRLTAYVSPPAGKTVSPSAVRARLARRLPAYMVPAAVVELGEWPLTPNGKIAARDLPAPVVVSASRPPRTPAEEVVCCLFADVLGVPEVGMDDGFFELGGHSLLATTLVTRLREVVDPGLTIRDLFDHPTPAALLARDATGGGASAMLRSLLPVRARGARPPLFCIHPFAGIGWCYFGLVRELDAETPVYALQARGLNGTDPLPASVAEMAADYIDQIRTVQPEGPYRLLGWSSGGLIAQQVAAALTDSGAEVDLVVMLDSHPADDIGDAAVTDANVLRLLLEQAGIADVPEEELTVAAVARLLRACSDTAMVGAVDEAALAAIIAVCRNTAAILAKHRPGVAAADLLYFRAGQGDSATVPGVERWREHVTGRMTEHVVDHAHAEMTSAAALADLGPILDRALSRPGRAPAALAELPYGHLVQHTPDVEDPGLPARHALVSDWLDTYICAPHERLGRSGPVCPFVRPALTAGQLSLVYRGGIDGSDPDAVIDILRRELRRFRRIHSGTPKSGVALDSLLVVFPDMPPEHCLMLDMIYPGLKEFAVTRGLMVGQFHPHCNEPAVRNPIFPVSRAPVPMLAARLMAPHDILFLHEDDRWFGLYRERFGAHFAAGKVHDRFMVRLYDAAIRRLDEESDDNDH